MSFSQHLVLWLHVAFVVFTIGPVTLAIMSTPRYIRKRDVRILRYLTRMTFAFAAASLGVLIAGEALASMIGKAGKPWVIVSATLFVVAILLLGLIHRDQRHAVRALEAASDQPADAQSAEGHSVAGAEGGSAGAEAEGAETADGGGRDVGGAGDAARKIAPASEGVPALVASIERGRIAMMGGVVSLIWLVILVLMVWNS
jgi:hypothetical protein